jgi:hypothetical protein
MMTAVKLRHLRQHDQDNSLSSEILREVIDSTASGGLDIKIPVGNLTGSNCCWAEDENPVKVIMLTSSYADFRNDISSAGINQLSTRLLWSFTVESTYCCHGRSAPQR